MPVFLPTNPPNFPDIKYVDDDGLLAYGGDLSPKTLIKAYSAGIFPWYNEDENSPILWWSPEPRCVIYPHEFKASRSLQKALKANIFTITVDSCFTELVRRCAAPRAYADGTWINPQIIESYSQLHQQGVTHSIEV